ncbi:unnamed protein product [Hymenolepis diminuta]|uniref:Uncharacterized protein n=1 Tax=Hymenolepis diminuta TaxID=6216 RepID=A0A564YP31_HYMDI|nr:unnamed protein product [Hymenolepis diminuta]
MPEVDSSLLFSEQQAISKFCMLDHQTNQIGLIKGHKVGWCIFPSPELVNRPP